MATNMDKAFYQAPQGLDQLSEQEEPIEIEIEKENEWSCVRDSSGKPGAVGNREDLERIARPEGARPCCLSDECFAKAFGECLRRLCENEN